MSKKKKTTARPVERKPKKPAKTKINQKRAAEVEREREQQSGGVRLFQ
jgi:hypothetical protein